MAASVKEAYILVYTWGLPAWVIKCKTSEFLLEQWLSVLEKHRNHLGSFENDARFFSPRDSDLIGPWVSVWSLGMWFSSVLIENIVIYNQGWEPMM